jgi:hypothetical protein
VKEVFANEWLGINFKEFSKASNTKLPDNLFYKNFYSCLERKYSSIENLPYEWLEDKRESSKELSKLIKRVSAKKILSIGSGIRVIENYIAKLDSSLKFYCEDFSSLSCSFINDHEHVVPLSSEDISNFSYDLIILINVDYALSNEDYFNLLQKIIFLNCGYILISDVFLAEKMTIKSLIGHSLKKFFGWQLWGYCRFLDEHHKIFHKVGLKVFLEGEDKRKRNFFILTKKDNS